MAKRNAPPKRKAPRRKPREIVLEPLNPFEEYGNESTRSLTHEILAEIDDGNDNLGDLVNALHAFDQYHLTNPRPSKEPLIRLLKSRGTTKAENELIADLIGRVVLKWGAGPRMLPAYMIEDDHHNLLNARADVQELQARGYSLTEAINQVSESNKFSYTVLEDVCRGQARFIRKLNAKKTKKRK
jgi:hypothetical protein